MTESSPVLAVVGHPNKGKSSIVATLAHDESVQISPHPGTTTSTRYYPMKVDGELLYTLADTPGFQRARHVLAWLRKRGVQADARAQAVADFVRSHSASGAYLDECELLDPIINGAGILYVVDGSKPYASEYEAEMEILRWSGRPSMALVNPIGSAEHVDSWRNALGQYFSVVRVFDAMAADFARQVALLRAFGELDEAWAHAFQRAVRVLETNRHHRHDLAAQTIADMIAESMLLTSVRDIESSDDADAITKELEDSHRRAIAAIEAKARHKVERAYEHDGLQRIEPGIGDALEHDLFDERTWTIFGLTPSQLAVTAALGGAVLGAGVDVLLGGASLMLGSAAGAVIGAASALLGGGQLADIRVSDTSALGGVRITVGPIKDQNFPYVLLGRALHHQRLVAMRTHAQRDALLIEATEAGEWGRQLHSDLRRDLERCFSRLRDADESTLDELRRLIKQMTPAVDKVAVDSGSSSVTRT